MKNWFYHLFNVIYPVSCMGCEYVLGTGESVLCTTCRAQLPLAVHDLKNNNQVKELFYARVPIEAATSLFYYEKIGTVQSMIHNLKYKRQEHVGEMLGKWLGYELTQNADFNAIDLVIPVPIHDTRRRSRGYNQVTKFGEELAGCLGVRFRESVLIKKRNTVTQAKLNQTDRIKETNSPYELNEEITAGTHILLVDDVITTGTTLAMCVRELQKIPDVRISIATMAVSV
ncbi:MAG: phosphoribosyltransferase family protein [Nonlabens sp.]|nr:phosphoribosyltransferase family protein [Nonlabens sp.]